MIDVKIGVHLDKTKKKPVIDLKNNQGSGPIIGHKDAES